MIIFLYGEDTYRLQQKLKEIGDQYKKVHKSGLNLEKIDALQMELANFIESIQGNAKPIVDGKAGRDALEVATNIQKMIIEDVH